MVKSINLFFMVLGKKWLLSSTKVSNKLLQINFGVLGVSKWSVPEFNYAEKLKNTSML